MDILDVANIIVIVAPSILILLLIYTLITLYLEDKRKKETIEKEINIGYEIRLKRKLLNQDETIEKSEVDNVLKEFFVMKYGMSTHKFLTYLAYCNHYDSLLKHNKALSFSYLDHCNNTRYNSFTYEHYGTIKNVDDFTIYESGQGGYGGGSSSSSSQSSHSYNFDDRRYV